MKLDRLIESLHPLAALGRTDVEVKGISADSRQIRPGYVFVAVAGGRHNGVDFISEARNRGAVGLVLTEFSSAVNSNVAQVKVDDTRRALALLSNIFFDNPAIGMKMIGITGTNGKTTVAVLSRSVFAGAGIPTGLLGTMYYGIGERQIPSVLTTPAPPLLQQLLSDMKRAGTTHVIMEVSSHALVQQRLAGIGFSTGVFTNLSREHLDYHRNMEDYRSAKVGFFENLVPGRTEAETPLAIINQDDPLRQRIMRGLRVPALTYGLSSRAELRASRLELSKTGSSFLVCWRNQSRPARISMPGRHNVYNTLAVIGLGLSEGIELDAILDTLSNQTGISGRLEQVETGFDFDLFVDYAHTPAGLENVLRTLRGLYNKRMIVVFGCGGDRDTTKRPVMGSTAARWADEVIVTSDNPRSEPPETIIEAIVAGIPRTFSAGRILVDRRQAIEAACRSARSGDVVLIAGKGHEQQQIFRDRVIPFSDRDEAREILREMKDKESTNGAYSKSA